MTEAQAELFKRLKVGDVVHVEFKGGIEGTTTGTVVEKGLSDSTDSRILVEETFWDGLSRRFHEKGTYLIVHARELQGVVQEGTTPVAEAPRGL